MAKIRITESQLKNLIKEAIDIALSEKAPKGWEKTVKAMKKDKNIDNPWALAHWMKKKGYQHHKKDEEEVEEYLDNSAWVGEEDLEEALKKKDK